MATTSISRALLRPSRRLVSEFCLHGGNGPVQVNSVLKRNMVSVTSLLLEQRTMKLPGLGDSITEGTIVEWTASVGQAVKEGDVVAMVETDKVTVDIKAEIDGVVTEHFCAIDDTVEVGAVLYKIDTDAEASAAATETTSASAPAAPPTETTSAPKEAAAPAQAKPIAAASSSHRTPSIKFLGKEGWAQLRAGVQTPAVVHIPPMYGRPPFSEEEMEALIMGGASIAPEVKVHSSGAMFG